VATMTALSPTASHCLDHQLQQALDLTITCRMLAETFRARNDPLMAVALARLSAELSRQVAVLLPLGATGAQTPPEPPAPEPPSGCQAEMYLADLGARLSHAALVAETDAMEPGLEAPVAALLRTVAALYRARRELLVLCTVVGTT
jgi:hypothetical protein